MNLDEIMNVLTLRYHPHPRSPMELTWRDFIEWGEIQRLIQPLIEGSIKKIIGLNGVERVAMGISGGIDTSTVLALTRKSLPDLDIRTFCIAFDDDAKEFPLARQVAEMYDTDHNEIRVKNFFNDLPKIIEIVDYPRWNVYPYYLFKLARDFGCDMLVTGDGGDEVFGGYNFRYRHFLSSPTLPLERRYLETHNRDWVPDQPNLFAQPFNWKTVYNDLTRHFANPLPLLGKVMLADWNGKLLYDFIPTNQALADHFGVRLFSPFLEPEVYRVATHIPYHLKYDPRNDLGKIVLRQILLENFGYAPATGGKIGWGMDIADMWDMHARGMCEDLFKDPLFVQQDIINKKWIPVGFRHADRHDPRYISKMLMLLALELWLRIKETS